MSCVSEAHPDQGRLHGSKNSESNLDEFLFLHYKSLDEFGLGGSLGLGKALRLKERSNLDEF
jgi:hypothetical protein